VGLLSKLVEIWKDSQVPFLISNDLELTFSDILKQDVGDLSVIRSGDVVALIGDFTPCSILTLLKLIELGVIIVPLTEETRHEHSYFFEAALVNVVIAGTRVERVSNQRAHPLLNMLRGRQHAGLVLFSTGTMGRPKAILHDFSAFLKRFETPRPPLRTISFLLFDHIGGINTLLHTLFNGGTVIALASRGIDDVLSTCERFDVEVLPTTPTFLRMMLISGMVPNKLPSCLQIISYGTERMDQPTLSELARLLPKVDFRQTYGMSELGILRVKSKSRDSLFMKVGGEGVETRVVNSVLQIRSASRMLGYLNAPDPFDSEGWYDTNDVVEVKDEYVKITGRVSDVINVGGLKFMASEVERVALAFPGVAMVKVISRENPITGQHVEMQIEPVATTGFDQGELMVFLRANLQKHMIPRRIRVGSVSIGHRFKKA
jgi:acyl-CoA synthetase (AMP-forming)/AMP-acid ligase II